MHRRITGRLVIATHNPELAARMDRRLRLDGGRLGLRPPDPGPA